MFNFNDNKKSINEISTMFDEGKLIVDESYQRRSVWSEKDKIRLIETILLQLVIPELFFWKANTDPETGISTTHIVDGQQRIKAIYDFINDNFRLKQQYLLDRNIKDKYANKYFRDLDTETKKNFWNYQLMIIEIDSRATRKDIITMFNRLNLTDYNLNDQEKRNSASGEFAALVRELSENPLWEKRRLFTGADVKRMKDVEFCASIVLLYRNGIIDQTDQTALNNAYEELQIGYKDAERDKEAVCTAIEMISTFFISEEVTKFLRRKAQLYTLFSIIFYTQREKIAVEECHMNRFDNFVKLYLSFNNDIDLTGNIDEQEKILFDWLKKYKLASSEGLNKHTNRMIRCNMMKNFIFFLTEEQENAGARLYLKMKNFSNDTGMEVHED